MKSTFSPLHDIRQMTSKVQGNREKILTSFDIICQLNECNRRICRIGFLKEKTVFSLVHGSNLNSSVIKDNRFSRNQCTVK